MKKIKIKASFISGELDLLTDSLRSLSVELIERYYQDYVFMPKKARREIRQEAHKHLEQLVKLRRKLQVKRNKLQVKCNELHVDKLQE
jgi:hypothetical protein